MREANVAQKPITVAQLLLLVGERSAGIESGFAKAMRDARAAGLVEPNPHWAKSGKPTVPYQLQLTALGGGAVEWIGCRRKTGYLTREVYCDKHGRAAGWPCRKAKLPAGRKIPSKRIAKGG